MRYYLRTAADLATCIKRCNFEAAHGRIHLALERLNDLADEFPGNLYVLYAEGMLRRDYLGQGIVARALFEQAYSAAIAPSGTLAAETPAFAACNLAQLAPNEAEFRRWANVALQTLPAADVTRETLKFHLNRLGTGTAHSILMHDAGVAHAGAEEYGSAAAVMEIVLQSGELHPDVELSARKHRARHLRNLDQVAHRYRETISEPFPPAERLALREALNELNQALTLDEYDPELWNLKAAWCGLLQEDEEAVASAQHAIALRPHHYTKPYINLANSLRSLRRNEEAHAAIEEGLRQAEASHATADLVQANRVRANFSLISHPLSLEELEPVFEQILRAAQVTCDEEVGQQGSSDPALSTTVVRGVMQRAQAVCDNNGLAYVPMMAELLSDFTPETVFAIIQHVRLRDRRMQARLLAAVCYIALHGQGVQRRDAARLVVLTLFSARKSPAIQTLYRKAILAPSEVDHDALTGLETVIQKELSYFHSRLPELIEANTPEEKCLTRLWRFLFPKEQ